METRVLSGYRNNPLRSQGVCLPGRYVRGEAAEFLAIHTVQYADTRRGADLSLRPTTPCFASNPYVSSPTNRQVLHCNVPHTCPRKSSRGGRRGSKSGVRRDGGQAC